MELSSCGACLTKHTVYLIYSTHKLIKQTVKIVNTVIFDLSIFVSFSPHSHIFSQLTPAFFWFVCLAASYACLVSRFLGLLLSALFAPRFCIPERISTRRTRHDALLLQCTPQRRGYTRRRQQTSRLRGMSNLPSIYSRNTALLLALCLL